MYDRRIDRNHPGCILFLIDQSYSMSETFAIDPSKNKASALSDAINSLLYELVLRCIKDPKEGPRHYYDVGVVGYGERVEPAFGGALAGQSLVSIAEIANNPLRVEDRVKQLPNGQTARRKFPIWFEPKAVNGTPMGEAVNVAGSIVAPWVAAHPDSFPPIVINISDGAASDGDPRVWSNRLQSLSTHDGNVLFFNVNLSALGGEPLHFPDNPNVLGNEYARTLFEMSSPLPKFMCSLARDKGHVLSDGARGFVFNADMVSVVQFLQIGTMTPENIDERTV